MPLKVVTIAGVKKLLRNGAALVTNANCCCECSYTIFARIRGGSIFGQVDGAGPVYSSYNDNNPPATNTLGWDANAFGEALTGPMTGNHTIRLWATALTAGDIDVNDISVENITGGPICINGEEFNTNTVTTFVIPIVEDAGYPSDQSGSGAGITLTITCGACP
jgi:hypothetical protein